MLDAQTTCWTLIHAAAAGSEPEREAFAECYGPVVRAYLAARWKSSPLMYEIGDATQDFFLECFREDGPLQRVEQRDSGFRAFLYGIVRNVALRYERREAKQRGRHVGESTHLRYAQADETTLSQIFDRSWARAMLQEAGQRQIENAEHSGEAAMQRVHLLRLRFYEGLQIREIANRWQRDAMVLHREYAKARKEFRHALSEVVAFHYPQLTSHEIERECADLLLMLK